MLFDAAHYATVRDERTFAIYDPIYNPGGDKFLGESFLAHISYVISSLNGHSKN